MNVASRAFFLAYDILLLPILMNHRTFTNMIDTLV